MIRCVHAILGLPRSGSTLLAALLRQNPAFVAGMTTPMFMLVNTFLDQVSPGREFSNFFDEDRRVSVLRSMFDGYYGALASGKIVFDTNRSWPPRSTILQRVYPANRIICCVRDVGWILDSFERVLRESPLHVSRIFLPKAVTNVFARAVPAQSGDRVGGSVLARYARSLVWPGREPIDRRALRLAGCESEGRNRPPLRFSWRATLRARF